MVFFPGITVSLSPSMNLSVFINLLILLVIMANSSSLSESSSYETLLLVALKVIPFAFLTGGREYS
jgi:hypothetical protein